MRATEHPLARERVRYCGEPVAAVAAIDDATAKEAIKRIELKVRKLPAYHTAQTAMAPGAVDLHKHPPNDIERDVYFELGDVPTRLSPRPIWCATARTIARKSCQNQMEMRAAIADCDRRA